ncbi:hypothetical protein U1Q18_033918 [Sarracenia purpurea var. burkii]
MRPLIPLRFVLVLILLLLTLVYSSFGLPLLQIYLSPSLLPSHSLFLRKSSLDHGEGRSTSMHAAFAPSTTPHMPRPKPSLEPSIVNAPSPLYQGTQYTQWFEIFALSTFLDLHLGLCPWLSSYVS